MQMIVSAGRPDGHDELERLLDKSRFVGLQVFDGDGDQVYENWGSSAVSLIDVLRAQALKRPERHQIHRTWIEVGSEHLIHVVVPISGSDGRLVGYVRTVSRLAVPREDVEDQLVAGRSGRQRFARGSFDQLQTIGEHRREDPHEPAICLVPDAQPSP